MKNKNLDIHKKLVKALESRQLETAENLINEGLKNDDNDALLHSYQGNLYGLKHDFSNAAKSHQKALELEPIVERHEWHKNNISLCITLLGEQLLTKGEHSDAKECFTKAISLFPLARSFQQLGHINYLEDDLESSFSNLDKAEELNDKLHTIYLTRGLCFFKNNKHDECETNLLKCIELNPAEINALIVLSKFYTLKGDLDKSIEHLNSAQLIQPNNLSILKDIIDQNIMMKKYDNANKSATSYLNNNNPVSRSILSQKIYLDEILDSDNRVIKKPFDFIEDQKFEKDLISLDKINSYPVSNNSNNFNFLDISKDKDVYDYIVNIGEGFLNPKSSKEPIFKKYRPKYLDIRFFVSDQFTKDIINGVSTEYSWLNGIICFKEKTKKKDLFQIEFNFSNTQYPENEKVESSLKKQYGFDTLVLFPAYLNYKVNDIDGNAIKLLSLNFIGFNK